MARVPSTEAESPLVSAQDSSMVPAAISEVTSEPKPNTAGLTLRVKPSFVAAQGHAD